MAPNWVLSCAHVALRGEGGGREVGLTFGAHTVRGLVEWAQPDSLPEGDHLWPAPDLALIRLLEPVPHSCVWLTQRTATVFTREEVAYFGCTDEGGEVEDTNGRCTIRGNLGANGLLKLGNEDEMPEGVSGGPVLDLARGEVIGVVKARRSARRDGGLAVSVMQLRRLPERVGVGHAEHDDLYQRVLRAHDRYHADRHRDDHAQSDTWTDVQSQLSATWDRDLTPGQRVELLGLLAELPPPVSTRWLADTVAALRGRPYVGRLPAPRGWRDGLDLLWQGRTELELVLRYAVHAATAERRPYPAAEDVERRLWEWASRTAADAQLPRWVRNGLGDEREARLRERARVAASGAWALGGPGPGAPPPRDETAQPLVLLEIIPHAWEPGRYDWRVCVTQSPGELISVDEDFRVVGPAAPPERLRAALAEAFRRGDEPPRRAPLHVALPYALLGFPVDAWRISSDDGTLGAQRPVVVRCTDQPLDEDEETRAVRHARWARLHTGPLEPVVLDCDAGRPTPMPSAAALNGQRHGTVPVLCRMSESEQPPPLRRLLDSGYDVALWRREPLDRELNCADFHRGVLRTAADAGTAGRLPSVLCQLRAEVGRGVPEAYWSQELALLYGDPAYPLPGVDQPLETP